jgi:drug/metabolite transporter (DMT)-like permease
VSWYHSDHLLSRALQRRRISAVSAVSAGGDAIMLAYALASASLGRRSLSQHVGELAALATAVCWSFTPVFFSYGGRRVGSDVVNRTRLLFALACLAASHQVLFGRPWPVGVGLPRLWWLGLSGVLGLVIGDAALFQAYVLVGPRLGTLMMGTVPIFSTAMAWALLGQTIRPVQLAGIAATVGAVAWVVTDHAAPAVAASSQHYRQGLLLGLVGALGQSANLVTARLGLGGGFPTVSASFVRIVVAAVVLWSIAGMRGRAGAALHRLQDRRALGAIAAGSVVGPFVGIWLSLVAIERTQVGVASTLMALPPVFLIPIGAVVYRERVTRRALAGTLLAFAGVAAIFLG